MKMDINTMHTLGLAHCWEAAGVKGRDVTPRSWSLRHSPRSYLSLPPRGRYLSRSIWKLLSASRVCPGLASLPLENTGSFSLPGNLSTPELAWDGDSGKWQLPASAQL